MRESSANAATAVLASIRAAGPVSAGVNTKLKQAESSIIVSGILFKTASDPSLRGPDRAGRLRGWLTPASALVRLTQGLEELEPLVPAPAPRLKAARESITSGLAGLDAGLKPIQTGPAHSVALARAQQDIERPREVIDTLRHEANRYAVSLVGLADAGRVWPDPVHTRYAFGGGLRLSLVNVNFTLAYALNPSPHRELGEGRGALLFSITYTNLFQ